MRDVFGPQAASNKQINALYSAALEVASRRSEDLTGLTEWLTDSTIVSAVCQGGRGVLGTFAVDAYQLSGTPVSEIQISLSRHDARPSVSRGEDVFTTLLHEMAHGHASFLGIKDTSNTGKYHNRRFGELAIALGCRVVRTGDFRGLATPGIAPQFRDEYADIIADLDRALVLSSPPRLSPRRGGDSTPTTSTGTTTTEPASPMPRPARYVFANCACVAGVEQRRTIRVAAGSWAPGSIICAFCGTAFSTESLTPSGQTASSPNLTTAH